MVEKKEPSSGVLPSRQRLGGVLSNPRALPPVTQGSALQAPECLRGIIRSRIPSTGQDVYLCLSPCDGCKGLEGDGGAD